MHRDTKKITIMGECSFCGKVFKYESEKKRHELSHVPRFECKKCTKKFTYISALKRHEKQHERTGNVQCEKCNRNFKDNILLKRHMKYAHEGKYVCCKCEAQFSSEQALRTHTLSHKPKSERRYSCSFNNCNKSFNFPHHLKYHEMTHTHTKEHYCNICGKGFIQSYNLKVHMQTHESYKKYPCEMPNCKKKFYSECARKRHYKNTNHTNNNMEIKEEPSLKLELNITKTTIKDTICCTYCGQIIQLMGAAEHEMNCLVRYNNNKQDYLQNLLQKKPIEEVKANDNAEITNTLTESQESISTCKTVLGKCLMDGDMNDNKKCLCAQILENNDNRCDTTTAKVIEDSSKSKLYTNNRCIKNELSEACEGCNNFCTFKLKHSQSSANVDLNCKKFDDICDTYDCKPEIEYGINNIIKIKCTFDFSFDSIDNKEHKTDVSQKKSNATQTLPYNSCKDMLGKCIVSGNSTMNDECLCAKMLNDEQQMTAQEIEEITPHPKYSNICL